MIIPKKYGGKGFPPTLTRSRHQAGQPLQRSGGARDGAQLARPRTAVALRHDEQKDHYLPRLPGNRDSRIRPHQPHAGSDAARFPMSESSAGPVEGREMIGMRVTWDKRYITLGPICTVLGLAFRLHDPNICSAPGKTSASPARSFSANTTGVEIGRRHLPLNATFQNGPTCGASVHAYRLDHRRTEDAGQGWRMLMECLAAGRSISLPSTPALFQARRARHRRLRARAPAVQEHHRKVRRCRGA